MSEPLQVGQFAIVDHEPVDRGPNAGIFEGKGPIDERAELFVVAEGTTPAGEAFAGHVVSAIGAAWGGFDMSLSGCLTAAFREAERNVWDWNRKSIAQHQVSIGLTCFAHRGTQAIVAQGGPSIAFHLHEGELRTYFPRAAKAKAIGSGGPPEPQFTRVEVSPGDRILLVSTVGLEEIDEGIVAGILALPGPQALQDLYQRVRSLRHVTAMLVAAPEVELPGRAKRSEERVPEEAPAEVVIDATAAHGDTGFQPSLFIEDEHEADVEAARQALVEISSRRRPTPRAPVGQSFRVEPLRRAVGDSDSRDLVGDFATRHQPPPATTEGGEPPRASIEGPRPIWNGRGEATPAAVNGGGPPTAARRERSFSRSLVGDRLAEPARNSTGGSAPPVGELAAERSRRLRNATSTGDLLAESAVAARGGLVRPRSSMGGRWKGNGALSRPTATGGGWFNERTVVFGGLALLVLLVAIVVGPRLIGGQNADPQALYLEAQRQYQAASAATDPTERRQLLAQAEALLLEINDGGGQTVESQSLLNQVSGAIATLNAVVAPASVETIADLSQFGTQPVTPAEMEVGGGVVYLLDTATSQVIAQPVDGSQPTVVYAVDTEAKQDRPVAIAATDAGVLVLDAGGRFWKATPGAAATLATLNAPAGLAITDLALHDGALYVLDSRQQAVFRFAPTEAGFEAAPTIEVAAPELARAVRLMVDDDVVTMTADGTIYRFTNGVALELSQAGIDSKIASAQQPRSFDGGASIAVPDPANDRVVVFRRDGTFDRQYQHDAFAALSALAVDADGIGYMFSGSAIRKIAW